MRVDPKYRTFWLRFWAGIIDSLLFVPLWLVDNWIWKIQAPIWVNLAWYVTFTFSFFAYSIVLHGRYGQTLGKRLCGVRVVDISERPLTMFQAAMRDLPIVALTLWGIWGPIRRIVEGSLPYPEIQAPSDADRANLFFANAWVAVELLTTLTNSKRRAVHDFLARSIVVRTTPT